MTPSNWRPHHLGEFLEPVREPIVLRDGESYRQLTVSLHCRGVRLRQTVTGAEVKTKQQYVARAGQFIYSRIDARNGAMGLVPRDLDGAIVTGDFPTFRVNTAIVIPQFFAYLIRRESFVERCRLASRGVTNRQRFKEPQLLSLDVPLPALAEQSRLVSQLDQLAARLTEARRLRDEIENEQQQFLRNLAREFAENVPREPLQSALLDRAFAGEL